MNRTVVSMVTTSTTNMTGFFIITRGSSLRKAAPIAGIRIFGSVKVAEVDRLRVLPPDKVVTVMMVYLDLRTEFRCSSRDARRLGPERAPGRRSGRRRSG